MLNLVLAVNTENLLKSLNVLWQGLLAIFIVVAIVIVVTYLLKYVVVKITDAKEKSAEKTASDEDTEN